MSFAKEVWINLAAVDCSDQVKKKGKMSYLSWAWAWAKLMDNYPESNYRFLPNVVDSVGSVEVSCEVTIADGDKSLTRTMWLPVMDYKNDSVINPTSREVSDNKMRCLTKAIAMFGMGHYIYAGEDLPDPEVTAEANKSRYAAICLPLQATIDTIKESIESGSYSAGSEAWQELSEEEKTNLWVAPTKGGVFTTVEREVMKSTEFRKASGEGQ
tara:strand:- start:1 stop:639 length:639 start_codon:yes stop_codon:yes gene_type:complete